MNIRNYDSKYFNCTLFFFILFFYSNSAISNNIRLNENVVDFSFYGYFDCQDAYIDIDGDSEITSYYWYEIHTGESGTVQANTFGNAYFSINSWSGVLDIEVTAYVEGVSSGTQFNTILMDPDDFFPYISSVEQNAICPQNGIPIILTQTSYSGDTYTWYNTNDFSIVFSTEPELIYDLSFGTQFISLIVENQCGIDRYDYEVTVGYQCICDGTSVIYGCSDPVACNYDPDVTCEDGSCISLPSARLTTPFYECDTICIPISDRNHDPTSYNWRNLTTGDSGTLIPSNSSSQLELFNDFTFDFYVVELTPFLNDCEGIKDTFQVQTAEAVFPIIDEVYTFYTNCPGDGYVRLRAKLLFDINRHNYMTHYWHLTNDPDNILLVDNTDFAYDPNLGSQSVTYVVENTCTGETESVDYFVILDEHLCVDDGDCTNGTEIWYSIFCECRSLDIASGCTDPTAANYDPEAICDDGSCDCPVIHNLSGVIPTDLYEASDHIISDGQVNANSTGAVSFQAANYIDLNAGFEADASFEFVAKILNCASPRPENDLKK